MSRVVAANTPSPVRQPKTDMPRAATCASPTLAQLLNGDDPDLEMTHPAPTTIPFLLSFTHLTYSVRSRRITKTILDDVSGEARDGEITAVMGASGSGKSTLIDALANRIARGSLKGSVTLNGEPLDSKTTSIISAYVMQDDLLYPMLTVAETLLFAAEFRLPRTLSKSKKQARVEALIDQLGLRNAANTLVGDEAHRGVSGGERRRVSIGIDIIHDPILLFLDEPTSGLDSTSAFLLVKVLQRIARSGSVVIMSVHQPSYRILELLDRIIFLSRGSSVYRGFPSDLPLFFADYGHPIPDEANRTEFALDLIQELESSPDGAKSLVEFNKFWQHITTLEKQTSLSLKEALSARGKLVSGETMKTFVNPPWIEIAVLSKRSFLNSTRTPSFFLVRLAAITVTGFILATVFWRLDDSPKGVQERLGFFAFAMSTTFYAQADALPGFIQERYIFMRETSHNAYRKSSYVLAHAVTSLPALMFLSAAFAAATFFAVGLGGSFFFYSFIVFSSFWAGNSFVTLISAVVPEMMLGYVIMVTVLAYFLLFSGFFINRDRIPVYWIWLHYASLVKYPYEGVLMNEFLDDPTRCFVRGKEMFDGTPLSNVADAMKDRVLESMSGALGMAITSESCLTTGADVLHQLGIKGLSKWDCLWVTVAWGFLFKMMFYLALLLGGSNKRR